MFVGGRKHYDVESQDRLTEVMNFEDDNDIKWTTFPAIELVYVSFTCSCNLHFKKNGNR